MAVIIVNTSADDNAANGVTSLREALAVAAGTAEADTIVFAAGISRIFLTSNGGPLVIAAGQNVTIDGDRNNDGVADVTIDSQTSTNHFIVQAGATARLEGLVLTNGAVFGATGVVGVQGAVGAKGQDGADGDTADAGANGTNGLAGGVGGVGGAGGAGAGSIFNLGALTLAQTQVVGNVGYGGLAGKGGTGGTGGEGGDGGRGGDAPEIFFFPGGPGGFAGDGGTGGKGGAGGTGGAGAGAIVNGAGATLQLMDTLVSDNVGWASKGGTGGTGGTGGRAGDGGDGGDGFPFSESNDGGDGEDGGAGGKGGIGGQGGIGGTGVGGILNLGTILTGAKAAFGLNFGLSGDAGAGGAAGPGGAGGTGGEGGIGTRDGFDGQTGPGGAPGTAGAAGTLGTLGGSQLNIGGGTGAVTDVDSLIFVSATNLSVAEGNSGATAFTFNVNRIGASNEAASVKWALAPGSGLTAAEFAGGAIPSGTVSFAAGGANSIAVTFQVLGDTVAENDEGFSIQLSNLNDPAGGVLYGLGTASVAGAVVNDEVVSRVYVDDTRKVVVASQFNKAGFLSALASLTPGQAIEALTPGLIGDIGAQTINARNLTVFADAPFDASFTLGGKVDGFTLLGTATADVTGNTFANSITGNAGANILSGLGGVDVIHAGDGADTVRVTNDSVGETYDGGAGLDALEFFGVNYIVKLQDDTIAGIERFRFTDPGANRTASVNMNATQMDGVKDVDGSVGVDVLKIAMGTLTTFSLNGIIFTGFANGGDQVVITGDGDNEIITGSSAADVISGGAGTDRMAGGAGDDIYHVDQAGDVVIEAVGQGLHDRVIATASFVLASGAEVELLNTDADAGTAAINLTGNEVAQDITGNAGANRLEGKGGADTLIGLSGADAFVFATKLGGGNVDDILDFFAPLDRFLLSDNVFRALTPGTIAPAQFRANTTGLAQDADDRIIYDTDSGGVFYDADGLGGAAGVQFALVGMGLGITRADFTVA